VSPCVVTGFEVVLNKVQENLLFEKVFSGRQPRQIIYKLGFEISHRPDDGDGYGVGL
jgi:hypothetical protein